MKDKLNFEPSVLVAIRMPADLHARAKRKARMRDLTLSQIVRKAIRKEVDSQCSPASAQS